MSIELDIIPNTTQDICWHEIVLSARALAADGDSFPNDLQLHDLKSKALIEGFEPLKCPGYYYCTSEIGSTLSLIIEPTVGGEEDRCYLSDVGHRLSPEERDTVFEKWMSAARLISIESGGGRPKGELKTAMAMAIAIAQLTSGLVVVKDSLVHNVEVGIYASEEILSLPWTS
ncbi:hypothetical protein ACYFX5_05380 [Bremerella sp. T1]|uniref:hypothetical protein n=1 Tax=Bremerella sp. TYQ1 TaxID=3119568 RepID=UPI001CCE6962|nr:hypothetical protein [Bremerella volcania]UBM37689.1 hypothetical protein LA756_07320 [Bremerella volcania]